MANDIERIEVRVTPASERQPTVEEDFGPQIGDVYLLNDNDDVMGPFKDDDKALTAAREDFEDNDYEQQTFMLVRLARKISFERKVEVKESE